MTLVIGIGCRRACPAEVIVALVGRVCADLDTTGARLCTIEAKRDERGLRKAADQLGFPLSFVSADRLRAVLPAVTRQSARVEAAVGVPSVAEAAALAGVGTDDAQLIVPRQTSGGATCAIARSGGAR